jgi:hypothetical protein
MMKRSLKLSFATLLLSFLAVPSMHAQGGPYGEWQKGCDAGEGDACDSMGMWNEFGGPSWPAYAAQAAVWYGRALAIYRRNCDGGKMSACTYSASCTIPHEV